MGKLSCNCHFTNFSFEKETQNEFILFPLTQLLWGLSMSTIYSDKVKLAETGSLSKARKLNFKGRKKGNFVHYDTIIFCRTIYGFCVEQPSLAP